ncbi:MAG: PBP1A family penicillin-binding protein [Candidatus Magasanikbacteria bacterium]|nr:PBP1A family penicillin-binding protein [Candidatus Magasanikbacteria bacterium]
MFTKFFSAPFKVKKYYSRLPEYKRREFRKKIGLTLLTVFVFCFFLGTILIAWANKDLPDPDKITDRNVDQSTKIYDRTGEHLLYEIFADKKRTIVELEDIPQDLINGAIATEDTKFYEHYGVRPLSILRAVVMGVFTERRIAGTSTLTQQLVKNAILTNERTYTRKLKEIILSLRLEQKYSKDQILKIYFNEIPYGSTNYGVESASQAYFGKHVTDLTLAESATLAGIPKAPSSYLNNTEMLKTRRNFVLQRMFDEGYISEEEKNSAQEEELLMEVRYSDIKSPHFVLYVKQKLVEKYGEQLVDTGGLRVLTTLDWEKQMIAENVVNDIGTRVLAEADADNTSLVVMDPKTGQILAMIGSKDFNNDDIDGKFNVATLGKRQPGSSFKPIIYAAAFEMGYTPETIIFDVLTNFAVSGRSYMPRNYDLQERGPVTMRQALQGSLNIPAVKTLYLVGAKKGVEFAERLGYTTLSSGDFGLSLVLGGGEVKLLEHVSAYSVFANGGTKVESVSILKVIDNRGEILEEWKRKRPQRVLETWVTNTISSVLSDNYARAYAFGLNSILNIPGRQVAAKTGTTNGYVDAWTIGYTPSLVAGVWAGNTDNTPMKRGYGGSRVAGPIWNAFMSQALEGSPLEYFPGAPANTATKPILRGSKGGSVTLMINRATGRIATSSTPVDNIIERTYIPPHSILHYLVKSNPRGQGPTNPANDYQYNIWEASIKDWIKRKQEANPDWEVSFEDPPADFDSDESLGMAPTIEVIFPSTSSTLGSRQIDTDIRFSSPRGIAKVTYQLNGNYVGVIKTHPFNLNYYATDLQDGSHTLTITAEDDLGNRRIEEITFELIAGVEPPSVTWVGNNIIINKNDFPYTFFLTPFKIDQIESVIIQEDVDGIRTVLEEITDFSNLFDGKITFTLSKILAKGDHVFIAEVKLKKGIPGKGDLINVKIGK